MGLHVGELYRYIARWLGDFILLRKRLKVRKSSTLIRLQERNGFHTDFTEKKKKKNKTFRDPELRVHLLEI